MTTTCTFENTTTGLVLFGPGSESEMCYNFVVAYPAEYGNSGVMTFIVNHEGKVFEKNLGPNTAAVAKAMKEYNPDSTWTAAKQ